MLQTDSLHANVRISALIPNVQHIHLPFMESNFHSLIVSCNHNFPVHFSTSFLWWDISKAQNSLKATQVSCKDAEGQPLMQAAAMRAQSWMRTPLVWRLMVLKLSWSYFWNGTGFLSQCCPAFQSLSFVSCIWSLNCVFNIIFSWHGLRVLLIFNIWIEKYFPVVVSAVQILVWFLLKGRAWRPEIFPLP